LERLKRVAWAEPRLVATPAEAEAPAAPEIEILIAPQGLERELMAA